jgi:hypothetical protein
MIQEGPLLDLLLRRLADTPRDFLDPPRVGNTGSVHVAALVFDLSYQCGQPCTATDLQLLSASPVDTNWLTLCAIGCWLLHEPGLQPHLSKTAVLAWLDPTLRALASEYPAERYLLDDERREEFARLALRELALRPAGETEAQAQDRLQALSSTERRRILAATRAAEQRAREIREALIRQAAAEAADKYTRE